MYTERIRINIIYTFIHIINTSVSDVFLNWSSIMQYMHIANDNHSHTHTHTHAHTYLYTIYIYIVYILMVEMGHFNMFGRSKYPFVYINDKFYLTLII